MARARKPTMRPAKKPATTLTGNLTHLGKNGEARMVDVSEKSATERVAIAEGRVEARSDL